MLLLLLLPPHLQLLLLPVQLLSPQEPRFFLSLLFHFQLLQRLQLLNLLHVVPVISVFIDHFHNRLLNRHHFLQSLLDVLFAAQAGLVRFMVF